MNFEVKEIIRSDPFGRHMGIEITEIGPGYAKGVLNVEEHMLNFNGVTHGAAVFALVDAVFAAAGNSHGKVALALNVNISFLKATGAGAAFTAVAEEENVTPKTALYKMTVIDGAGDKVAVAQGIVYRKNEFIKGVNKD